MNREFIIVIDDDIRGYGCFGSLNLKVVYREVFLGICFKKFGCGIFELKKFVRCDSFFEMGDVEIVIGFDDGDVM